MDWASEGTWLRCSLSGNQWLKKNRKNRKKKNQLLALKEREKTAAVPSTWSRADVTMATFAVGPALVNTIRCCRGGAAARISAVVSELVVRGTSGVRRLRSRVLV